MKEPFVLIIAGSPRSGKTYWITNFIKKMKKDPMVEDPILLIFCGSIFKNKEHDYSFLLKARQNKKRPYRSKADKNAPIRDFSQPDADKEVMMKKAFCTPTFSQEKLDGVLNLVSQNTDKQFIIIFDDMMADPNMKWNTDGVKNIFGKYRHYGNMSIIIAVQHITKIPITIRETAKFAMVFAQKTKRAKEAIIDSYLTEVDNVKELDEFFGKNNIKLGNHKFLFKNLDKDELI